MHGRDHRGGIWGLNHRQGPTGFMHTPARLGIQTMHDMYIYIYSLRAVIIRRCYRGLDMLAAGSVVRMYDDCNCKALI